jgi:hypothetical protein
MLFLSNRTFIAASVAEKVMAASCFVPAFEAVKLGVG